MNDETTKIQKLKQLEAATARGRASSSELDEETAELREGWLSFSQLMEAADAKNQALPMSDFVVPHRRDARLVGGAIVVAASLVLAVASLAWLLWDLAPNGSPIPSPTVATNPVDPVPKNVPARTVEQTAVAPLTPTRETEQLKPSPSIPEQSTADLAVTWNDSWDDQLDAAREQLTRVQTSWNPVDVSLRSLSWRMEQMDEAFSEESL